MISLVYLILKKFILRDLYIRYDNINLIKTESIENIKNLIQELSDEDNIEKISITMENGNLNIFMPDDLYFLLKLKGLLAFFA